jgi:N-acyl-D-aspartate/D-glutamate deacylase
MHDLVIRDATVVDGTGAPRRSGDVAVDGGRISQIGEVDEGGRESIDAAGRVLAPGFIDVHTHLDVQGFWDTTLSPTPLHGITTAIAGNCGFSVAPLIPEHASYIMRMLSRVEEIPVQSLSSAVPWDWESTEQYLAGIDGTLAINTGYMVGHSPLRVVVMGADATDRPATTAEIEQMVTLLAAGLRAGGLGFSTSYSITHADAEDRPVPSRLASREEFVALASVCRDFPGTSLEIIVGPPPGPFEPEKAELMLEMTRAAQRPLNWNIMFPKASNVDLCLQNLELSAAAASQGGRIAGLAMAFFSERPFRFRSLEDIPGLGAVFELADEELASLLSDPAGRANFEALSKGVHKYQEGQIRWPEYRILETVAASNKRFEGQLVGDIAQSQGKRAFDVLCDIVVADRFQTVVAFDTPPATRRDWEALVTVWRTPGGLVGGSDAGAHLGKLAFFNYTTTLLAHGVRDHGALSLEEGVQLLTSKPAELYGLVDRGQIAVGAIADLVLFDEATVGPRQVRFVDDLPGGASRLFGGADGIGHVFVAGREIVRDGSFTEARPGRVLRSGKATRTPTMVRGADTGVRSGTGQA